MSIKSPSLISAPMPGAGRTATRVAFLVLLSLGLTAALPAAPFTPGNLVVYRVNNGAAALVATGTAVFLDEYTTAGALVQSIAVPTTTVGAQRRLVCSGTATTEGLLTRSTDGQYVVFGGYDAALLDAVTTSASTAVPRVIGRVAGNGTLDTTTALTDAISGGNPRGAASTNGTDLWLSGTSTGGGIRYATLGATTSTSLVATPTNIRAIGISGGQLYVSSQTGAFRLSTVGTGTPTTAGQTMTNLPGFPTATGSPIGFFFADLTAAVAGDDTVYVADDGGTIQKFSLVAGSWTANGTIALSTARGITGSVSGSNVTLYVTARTLLRTLTDTSGYNATITGTVTTLATAATNTAIQGVAFVPVSGVVLPNLTVNDVSLNEGNAGATTFTFTVSLSAPAGAGGVTFDIATADGTAQDDTPATEDNDYVAKSLTAQTIPAGSSTYTFDVMVNGDLIPETNETFFVNVTNVTGATVTDGQGQGTIVNDDAAPNLTINDVALNEGNASTTTFTFTVSLSAPAGAGGVTFDIATADGTAQDDTPATEDNDYVAKSLTGQTIPAGSSTYTFDVLVNGDVVAETDETFFVNVTNVTNAIATDGQGQGTIVNDDITFIHDVQGSGAATPIPGATVTVVGIVTANFQGADKLQGFFMQEENADADANPATSEGIFVFCITCPTPVAEGQQVRVTGSVSEFFNLTEITASTAGSVVVQSSGNPLPTAATIDLPVVGVIDDFYEPRESMRVNFVDSLTVSEYFEQFRYGTIELYEGGRPFQFTETAPPNAAGNTAYQDVLARRRVLIDDDDNVQNEPLTKPDGMQFMFHPRNNGGLSIGTQGIDFFRGGDLVNNLTGVLHWSFSGLTGTDAWRVRPTAATPVAFTVANPRPATPPAVGGAIKAVGMNLLNYFTTIDTTSSTSTGPCGPGGTLDCRGADNVPELNRQRERAALVICTLNADVYGFMELENTTASATITDLLGAVNTLCGGANPYAFVNTGGTLGTDAIRVQLIYRTNILSPVGAPLSDLDPVHNRPPTAQTFDVVAVTNPAFGQRFTVIANHFKSKGCPGTGGDADSGDGQSCFAATRTAQSTRLLSWINSTVLPAAGDPDVLLVGDFNSYAQETPITTITAAGYSDLESALLGPTAYSYLFDGQLGHLDYALSSASLTPQVAGVGAWHINADENPVFDYNDEVKDVGEAAFEEKPDGSALVPPRVVFQPATAVRASDHDPVIVGLFKVADLAVTKTDSPDPVTAGNNITYTITVSNNGPDAATSASWSDTLPPGTTFVSLPAVAGWSCSTGATVSCSNPSFAVGSAVFTLTVAVAPSVTAGTVLTNAATATSATPDSNGNNNTGTATTTVATSADLSVTKTDSPDPVTAGNNITYTITVTNLGPSNAASASWTDTLPAGTTFVSMPTVAGWSCTTGATISCSNPSFGVGSSVFTLTVAVAPSVAAGTVLSNSAIATSTTSDPNPSSNNTGTATTTVAASADLSITKVDTPDPVVAGHNITYTITVTNAGPSNAASASWTDTLPGGTTFVSLPAVAGWSCSTGAIITCSNPSFAPGSAVFTLTVNVALATADGTVLTNTATVSAATSDSNGGNNSATATTTVNSTGNYFTVTPCRAVDTRAGTPIQNGVPETFSLHGTCGVSFTAKSIAINLTVVEPSGSGEVTIHAADVAPPPFGTLSFPAGATRGLVAVVALSNDVSGEVDVEAAVAGNGTVHLLIDVVGYFE